MASTSEKYDVFLSFRGEDTRYGITGHIYAALQAKKIETYIDDKSLERGDEIYSGLMSAIERSTIAVVVFSKDYASSAWCLSELVHIHECRRRLGLTVLPIFYEVDPSHVRNQDQGSYKDAFEIKHKNDSRFNEKTIQDWKAALNESAKLSGCHYSRSGRTESSLVEEVVGIVLNKLSRPLQPRDDFDGRLIGMRNHYNKIESLLRFGSPKLQIVGIWGMPGIGKTTIADAVFKRLFPRFESSYFLGNVRESSQKHGLERLRDGLIVKLLGDEKIDNFGILPSPIPDHAKDRLRRTKVLLVLDDISEKKQLEYLVGDHIGNGSKIIVTTRDEGVLRGTNIKADFEKYDVKLLSFEEALQLFSLTTFGENSPPADYENLSKEVVKYVGCNPLALTVLGSHLRSLRNPCRDNWEMELEKLKEFPHGDILKVLRISYEALGKTEQKIFLDIACFFKGARRDFVQNILNGCKFFANTGIDDLIDKSLVTTNGHKSNLNMHDLLQQMAWQIVREESEEPGNRSRLWIAEDTCYVFNNDTGTPQIEGIFLNTPRIDEDLYMKPRVFQRMIKLRLLIIYDSTKYTLYLEPLQCFPQSLRYLEWHGYPLKSLPSNFSPRFLVELRLPYSQLHQLWVGIEKNLNNLNGIDLRHSINLSQIPDLSCAQNLKTINLGNCRSLVQLPWHIFGKLDKLSVLDLRYCDKLGRLPESIDARELKTLNLEGCLNLKTVPRIVSTSLVSLNLSSTSIVSVPPSICSLNTNISKLVLDNCKSLVSLPGSISRLHLLKKLDLRGCSSLEEFPELLPTNIEKLVLSDTPIKLVPPSAIEGCSSLREISFQNCKRLESLPPGIFELTTLVSLDLRYCPALKHLPEISITTHAAESNLENLYLDGSGIVCLPPSFGNHMTSIQRLELNECKNLVSVGDFCGSRLKSLSLRSCRKIQSVSGLPFTLKHLDATGCRLLKEVLVFPVYTAGTGISYHDAVQRFPERRRMRFWDRSRGVTFDTFDYTLFSDCSSLNRSSRDSILTEFQHKVLHMATHYEAPKSEVETPPAITTFYVGEDVPYWFDYQPEYFGTMSGSVTITLPSEWRDGDILGFALCSVSPGPYNISTDFFCKIEFKGAEGVPLQKYQTLPESSVICSAFVGPETTKVIPVSMLNHVVMWYKHWDYSSRIRGCATEASFKFSIGDRGNYPSSCSVPTKCGVHMVRSHDLDDLGLTIIADGQLSQRVTLTRS